MQSLRICSTCAGSRFNTSSTSIVHPNEEGDMQPGAGFFQLAKKLGRDTSDKTICWVEELRRVHGHWRQSNS